MPTIKLLSIVAILLNRTSDVFLMPFPVCGCKIISVGSIHWSCVVMKETVTSSVFSINTNAGRNLVPAKLVKGNGIKTISPFDISAFL